MSTPPGEGGDGATPMMRQWRALKDAFPDAILFFRLGDFYEMFHEDAETGARELGITLTGRDAGAMGRVPMCGVPHHSVDQHIARLVSRGYRVAVCDQVEDPAEARGIVTRRVTRIVTPGSRLDPLLLDERRNTYLVAAVPEDPRRKDARWALAFADASTGELAALRLEDRGREAMWEALVARRPAELVCPDPSDGARAGAAYEGLAETAAALGIAVTRRPARDFDPRAACERLRRHFGVRTLAGFDVPDDSPEAAAAGALLAYIEHTLQGPARQVTRLLRWEPRGVLRIDEATRRNLEIEERLDGGERGSLVWAVDETVTAMGARLLRAWFAAPPADAGTIADRHAAVAGFVEQPAARAAVRRALRQTQDVERLVARLAAGRAGPRDLFALSRSLAAAPSVHAAGAPAFSGALAWLAAHLLPPAGLVDMLSQALADDPPASISEGGAIREGWSRELDELRALGRTSRERVAALEEEERARTGIRSLRVGYNRVFGYYIEVTKPNLAAVPPDYIRKQTLANAERFVTEELKDLEERLLHAEERALALEASLFRSLCDAVLEHIVPLQALAGALALCDVAAGLAEVAAARGYVRPELTEAPVLRLSAVRHPVVEALLGEGRYVPADVDMGEEEGRFLLVTGPNMAGKSTYARAVALCVVLAHVGSFVPAREAVVGLADAVFSRIGARDDLASGESTFMREMIETSRILRGATRRSVVIVDEVGRGTSTYDGLAIAWAVTEDLAVRIGARTIFTTHYHELTSLAGRLPAVRNQTMAVREDPATGRIEFLHTVVPGAADRSYGLQVAALAGVPAHVLERAGELLARLEAEGEESRGAVAASASDGGGPRDGRGGGPSGGQGGGALPAAVATGAGRASTGEAATGLQLSLLAPGGDPRGPHPLERMLASLDLDALPPRDALALLYEWKRRYGKRGR